MSLNENFRINIYCEISWISIYIAIVVCLNRYYSLIVCGIDNRKRNSSFERANIGNIRRDNEDRWPKCKSKNQSILYVWFGDIFELKFKVPARKCANRCRWNTSIVASIIFFNTAIRWTTVSIYYISIIASMPKHLSISTNLNTSAVCILITRHASTATVYEYIFLSRATKKTSWVTTLLQTSPKSW